jgi:hypothetical protein
MKKVIINRKNGSTAGSEMLDPTQWIADCVASNVWGQPERVVDDIEGTYDPADVLEEIDLIVIPAINPMLVSEAVPAVLDEQGATVTPEIPAVYTEAIPAVIKKQVKLKAEYTIEILDITEEYARQECIQKRKSEYPSPEEFMNAYFDGGEQAVAELQAKRLAVKAKYPKP